MKIYPNKLLEKIKNDKKNSIAILLYGNENGLISKLTKSIHSVFKNQLESNEITYFDYKKNKEEEFKDILNNQSLFSKINFIVVENPQDKIISLLQTITLEKNILIINGEGISAKSKIKGYFDTHLNFISVPCYKLNKHEIKKIVDDFLSTNNITLEKNAYWFLVENINDEFLTLENELDKLYTFKNSSLTLIELQKIISQKNNINVENYFFNCVSGNYKLILKDINLSLLSIDESYEIIRSVKRFMNILMNAVIDKDNTNLDDLVNKHFPRYLFMKKDLFKEVLKKTNSKKINKILKLIQKTESLLRKNSQLYREITERFLLNIIKVIK